FEIAGLTPTVATTVLHTIESFVTSTFGTEAYTRAPALANTTKMLHGTVLIRTPFRTTSPPRSGSGQSRSSGARRGGPTVKFVTERRIVGGRRACDVRRRARCGRDGGGMRIALWRRMTAHAARAGSAGAADLLTAALTDTADGVALLDQSGRIRFANAALAAAWCASPDALVGRPAAEFVAAGAGSTALVATVRGRTRWRGEVHGIPPYTGAVWDVTVGPTRDGAVAVFRDCAERHAVEELRADFLSMITHDIKAPL